MTDAPILEGAHTEASVFTAGTVEDAIHLGLTELGMDKEEADIRVLGKGSRGFLGLGSRPARVRLVPRTRLAPTVLTLARGLLERMEVRAEVEATQVGLRVDVRIEADTADGLLIGRRGETLDALQHVLTRMASRELEGKVSAVQVDVGGYRSRRQKRLEEIAQTLAERARRTGKRGMTEPLPPHERRIVHRAIADEPGIETHAGGAGINKRVIIISAPSRNQKR